MDKPYFYENECCDEYFPEGEPYDPKEELKRDFDSYMKWVNLMRKMAQRKARALKVRAATYDKDLEITHGRLDGVDETLEELGRAVEF